MEREDKAFESDTYCCRRAGRELQAAACRSLHAFLPWTPPAVSVGSLQIIHSKGQRLVFAQADQVAVSCTPCSLVAS